LFDSGDLYRAYEIESSKAFHADFMNNLRYLKFLLDNAFTAYGVIYDRENELNLTENGMFNFRTFSFN